MPAYLLGIDYGTGGAKACISDNELNILSYAFREYHIIMNKLGWSEHDPKLYWEIACTIIKECIEKSGIEPKYIKGLAVSSALPSMVMVDKNHNPINLAYNLMDRRATEEVRWIRENIGDKKIFKLSANRLEDHPSLVNLMWEKKNRPEVYSQIYKALTIDGFITLKLTGEFTLNYSAAAFYGVAYNIVERVFNIGILNKIGIDENLIPDLHACEDVVGEVTPQAASETGLVSGIPVIAGQVDCNAGWVGGGCIEEGDVHINLGTCGVLGIIHKNTNFVETNIAIPYTIDSKNTYVSVACTTTGGQLLRYFRDNFSHTEVMMEKLINNYSAYDYLNMEAERVKLGSEGLVILPYLAGERTPIWDVEARGVIFGLSLNHTKAHIIRAMMESVAYALYHSFEMVLKLDWKISYPIVLNEGGAKSRLWRRIITDIFNIPTVFLKERTGAPFGDVVLAGVATGILKNYSVAKEKAEYIDPIEPIKENHEQYMLYFSIYKNLYEHLKEDFKDLARLRKKK